MRYWHILVHVQTAAFDTVVEYWREFNHRPRLEEILALTEKKLRKRSESECLVLPVLIDEISKADFDAGCQ